MELSNESIKRILGEAFDLGYNNSNEFKEELLEELFKTLKEKPIEEFRVYKISELKNLPEGTIFDHSERGRCWIVVRGDGQKAVQFQKGGVISLVQDSVPWDQPMKLLHSE